MSSGQEPGALNSAVAAAPLSLLKAVSAAVTASEGAVAAAGKAEKSAEAATAALEPSAPKASAPEASAPPASALKAPEPKGQASAPKASAPKASAPPAPKGQVSGPKASAPEAEDQENGEEPETEGPGNPMANQLTGEVMDTAEINIAGANFHIRYDKKSKQRRKKIFLTKTGNYDDLTTPEKELLVHLCIEDDTYDAVRMYLYDFFEALPNCQSSAAILSNRQCEVSYYVLWSVLLKARQDVQRKIDEATSQSLIDSKLAQYQARLKSMTSRDLAPYDGPKPCDASAAEHQKIMDMIEELQAEITKRKGGSKQSGGNKQSGNKQSGNKQSGNKQSGGGLQELQRIYELYA